MTQQTNNTPAAEYLHSRKLFIIFMKDHRQISAMLQMEYMCACISELTSEVCAKR